MNASQRRTVAITGAGSGIGRAVAVGFVAAGYEVYASDVSATRLDDTVVELGRPETLHTEKVDVSSATEVADFVTLAAAATGTLDVMVNCAGVFDGYADIVETTPELWNKVIGINLTGAFHGCRAAAQVMIRQRHGRIITVGSVAGQRGAADGLAYVTSKAGIEGMNRRLAIDVGPHNVTANVVAPGVIRTNLRATSEELLGDLVSTQQRGIGVITCGDGLPDPGSPFGGPIGGGRSDCLPRLRLGGVHQRPGDRRRWWLDRNVTDHRLPARTVEKGR